MNRKVITSVVVFGSTGLLIAYDVWAAFVPGATISEVMLNLAHRHPIIPFALGILFGHFYWSQAGEAQWQETFTAPLPQPLRNTKAIVLVWGSCVLMLGLLLAALTYHKAG